MDRWLLHEVAGKSREAGIHEMLVLDGAARFHVVEAGCVAVFCAEVDAGKVVGPRRFLFRVGTGEPLLSVPLPPERGLRLLAVPVEDSRLADVPLASIAGNGRAAPLVDAWVNLAGRFFAGFHEPAQARKVSGTQEVSLEPGESLRPESDAVLWVEVGSGDARCMGGEEMALGPGLFPLGSAMWVTARAPLTARTRDTAAVGAELEAALGRFQRALLGHLGGQASREEEEERARLRERARRQAQQAEGAITELHAIFEPRLDPPPHDTPLMTAFAAVAMQLGIEVKPPRAEELRGRDDPVDVIARASRVRTRRVLLAGAWWRSDCGPLLAWSAEEPKRPLALLQTSRLQYEILDPASGIRTRLHRRSAAGIDPRAVMLYRPLPRGAPRLRDLLAFSLGPRRRDLAVILLAGVAATLLSMLTPQAMAVLMDDAIPGANRRLLVEIGLGLLAAALGQAIFALSQGFLLVRLSLSSEAETQAAMWDRLLSLRPAFFRGFSSGDLASRVQAATTVGRELNGATLRVLFSSALGLLNLFLLLYYSATLALIALGVTAASLAVTATSGALLRKRFAVLQEMEGKLYGLVIQLVGGVNKLRVAGAEPRAYTHWVRRYADQLRIVAKTQQVQDRVGVFNTLLPTASTICLYWFGLRQLLPGAGGEKALSIGTFLAFNAAFGSFLGAATSLSSTVVGILDTVTKGKRIAPILEADPEVDPARGNPGALSGRVALERATFRYREDGPKVLDDVSLHAEPGEFVAIVGPSGSGKSTLFRLLLGFEEPEAGAILFDGQDLKGLDAIAVRRQLGVVLQSGTLNAGSILDNIAGGNVVTMEQAAEAARDAGMEEDLAAMPMGLHTVVSEGGGNLSGGQRQRLLIARALVARPRILLFDEATSALDNRTQAIVGKSLAKRNVTRIVIAHRLSAIRDADRIYVLQEGRVAQSGTFTTLASQDGLFARMMARQMV